jgi:hypothetical protein
MKRMIILLLALPHVASADVSMVRHVPPAEAPPDEPLRLVASVDDAWAETALVLRWRPLDGATYSAVPFERSSAGGWYATIPGPAMHAPGVAYYILGSSREGGEVVHFASADAPHVVRVEPTPEERWTQAERARLLGRTARVRARFQAASFGTDDGDDWFARGEVDWTHRLVSTLYSFTLGYGFVQGVTPAMRGAAGMPGLENGARYGYGEVRWRAHESVWLDTGVMLGFSQDGFSAGTRANLTLGKEWRSCVQLGFEYLGGLGKSGWLRLQWDTVTPLLMGAEVRLTDLPGAVIPGGVMLTVDAALPVGKRVTIGVQVTYAARSQTQGSFGGGLSTAFEF